MPTPANECRCTPTTSTASASRLSRHTGARRELTALEQRTLHQVLECCERRLDHGEFFQRLAAGALTPAALRYVFGQYGHFRLQLHRWFAACIILADDASQPAQRQAILALADHIFTDLRDDHDLLFGELLHGLGFPAGTLHAESVSPATTAYIGSFLNDCRASEVSWLEAVAALSGRELSVALRNQRLLKSYFRQRGLREPTWLTLHAELEIDHFLDVVGPVLTHELADVAPSDATFVAIDRAFLRHVEFLDALLLEHETDVGACAPNEKRE